jgi:hypothetical protein
VWVPGLGGLISRCFVRFGCFAEDQLGGLAGDVFHLAEHAAKFALVGDPFGVAGGLAFGEPGGDGLAGDFAGELVVGAVRPTIWLVDGMAGRAEWAYVSRGILDQACE